MGCATKAAISTNVEAQEINKQSPQACLEGIFTSTHVLEDRL
jgi:hypothetical protein